MTPAAPPPATDDALQDLGHRLAATRRVLLPESSEHLAWSRGTDADYLSDLLDYWATDYNWREHEQRIRSLPWTCTPTRHGDLRSIHQPATGRPGAGQAVPVVLLHGWPDSVLRFERVLPLLGDVDVVVPALPGFPFAEPLTRPGTSVAVMAEWVAEAMRELGYSYYVVSGADVGGDIAEHLAGAHPDRVLALHLSDVSPRRLGGVDVAALSPVEREFAARKQAWRTSQGAYLAVQSATPHSLAVALGDSPAGLAAWLVDKYRAWSDCAGDVERVFPRPDLLTWITSYWLTGTIGTSLAAYVEPAHLPARVHVPTVGRTFTADIPSAPRAFAERFFDVRAWDTQSTGGHFAAWERPAAFVEGLRPALDLAAGADLAAPTAGGTTLA